MIQLQIAEDAKAYIHYLEKMGLSITVHGTIAGGLLEHNIHRNPFCTMVKTDDCAWQQCIQMQTKIFQKAADECIFGMCYAGVEEYIFFVDEKTFISVGAYGIDRPKALKRIKGLSERYYLKEDKLIEVYEQGLKHELPDPEELKVLIKPLCHMITLLNLYSGEKNESKAGPLFDSILRYVQRSYMKDLTNSDIASACFCSVSTVSHLFKKYKGQSVKQYVMALRIEQAKKLLETSKLPVSTVAVLCGYSNMDYFSTAFKKKEGVSPSLYRKQHRAKEKIQPEMQPKPGFCESNSINTK